MQLLYVFRGCLLAYAFGVLGIGAGSMIVEGDGPEIIWIIALFGLFVLIPFLIVTAIIWAVLAGLEKTVTRRLAAAICAGVFFCFAVLLGYADGGLLGLLAGAVIAPMVGAVFGLVFWIGAFGLRAEMKMAKQMPQDWWD